MANFALPSATSSTRDSANQMSDNRRPLTQNVAALIMDTSNICGTRILTGGATADAVGQVSYVM